MESPRLSKCVTQPVRADFIPSLQRPTKQILWIGCCDSNYGETTILNLLPDEMLEHRNIGSMIVDGDLSCETTVKHAVVDLQVKHIVVCGHYGCGIVRTKSRDRLKDPWLLKLNALHAMHHQYLDQLPNAECDRSFVELNILEQLRTLRRFPEVADAMRRGKLYIHGIIYDPVNGKGFLLDEAEGEL